MMGRQASHLSVLQLQVQGPVPKALVLYLPLYFLARHLTETQILSNLLLRTENCPHVIFIWGQHVT